LSPILLENVKKDIFTIEKLGKRPDYEENNQVHEHDLFPRYLQIAVATASIWIRLKGGWE